MDLSAEHLIRIVTSSSADPTGQPAASAPIQPDVEASNQPAVSLSNGHEQRRQPRVGLQCRATIIPLGEGSHPAAMSIQVRDLSQAGIGFIHKTKMSLDQQFALVLPRENDTPSVVLCAVAFWQPLARDVYAIGARFCRILRDGGDPPLPIILENPTVDLASEISKLHRKAS